MFEIVEYDIGWFGCDCFYCGGEYFGEVGF